MLCATTSLVYIEPNRLSDAQNTATVFQSTLISALLVSLFAFLVKAVTSQAGKAPPVAESAAAAK